MLPFAPPVPLPYFPTPPAAAAAQLAPYLAAQVDPSVNTSSLTVQSGAYAIEKQITIFVTGSTGSGGRLFTWSANALYLVLNRTGIIQNVWPDVGSEIEELGDNAPLELPPVAAGGTWFVAATSGLWRAI